MKRLLCISVVLLLAPHGSISSPAEFRFAQSARPSVSVQPTFGIALVGGGGPVEEAERFLCGKSAGGEIVVLQASKSAANAASFGQLCPENTAATLAIASSEDAQDPRAIATVRRAHAIFIGGGDQHNYVKFWTGTALREAVNSAVQHGVPIGGTSAGLAVLGEFAFSARHDTITSAQALRNPYDAKLTLEKSFLTIPLLKGIITDSHFSERNRMGRTIAFLSRIVQDGWAPAARAIGIDEATAVLVDGNGLARVVGKGHAYFLQLANRPAICRRGLPLSVRDVEVIRLAGGSSGEFDLRSWKTLQEMPISHRSVLKGQIEISPHEASPH